MTNMFCATTTTFKIGQLVQIGDSEAVGRIFKIDADARCSVNIFGEVGSPFGETNDDTNSFTPGCLRLVGAETPLRSEIDRVGTDLTELMSGFELMERTAKHGQLENGEQALEDIGLLASVFCRSICTILDRRLFAA